MDQKTTKADSNRSSRIVVSSESSNVPPTRKRKSNSSSCTSKIAKMLDAKIEDINLSSFIARRLILAMETFGIENPRRDIGDKYSEFECELIADDLSKREGMTFLKDKVKNIADFLHESFVLYCNSMKEGIEGLKFDKFSGEVLAIDPKYEVVAQSFRETYQPIIDNFIELCNIFGPVHVDCCASGKRGSSSTPSISRTESCSINIAPNLEVEKQMSRCVQKLRKILGVQSLAGVQSLVGIELFKEESARLYFLQVTSREAKNLFEEKMQQLAIRC